jgi:hypothetical protein
MLIPPDTTCSQCGKLLMSAAHSDKGGTALIMHHDPTAIRRMLAGAFVAVCTTCESETPAITLMQLQAQG